MDHFTYLPPFKRTTLIKPMNKEEEEAPLEDPHIHPNHLARERHAPGLKKINMVQRNRGTSQCLKVISTH
jgi:hypothetical protein